MVSTGAKLTTMENLGDNVTVAANSVVTKSIVEIKYIVGRCTCCYKKITNRLV